MKPSFPSKQIPFVAIIALVIIAILVTIAMAELFATATPYPDADYTFQEEITTLNASITAMKAKAAVSQSPVLTGKIPQSFSSIAQSRIQGIPEVETEADTE